MFKRILEFFFGKKEAQTETPAPYKVEPPVENVVFVDRGTVVSMPVPVVVDASLDTKLTVATAEPAKKTRKPRANVAAKKIAAAKKPAAKKPTTPKAPKAE